MNAAPTARVLSLTRSLTIAAVAGVAALECSGAIAGGSGFDQGFRMPSGNIVCAYSTGSIRCDIGTGVRPLPPRPADCDVDFGQGVDMARRGRAHVVCAGDTVSQVDVPTLRYGRTWRRGGLTCVSRSVGLTCRNLSGRGFFMSRARTRLF